MAIQEIQGEDYMVQYDSESVKINFQGELSLSGLSDYEPIKTLLENVAATEPATLTLNVKELSFLNSSGISMLSKFVMNMRRKPGIKLVVLGSQEMPWQSKFLKNLQKEQPSLQL